MCYHVYTMGETVGVRALRQRASALLQRMAAGEVVTVTDRGRPVARLVPLRGGPLEQLVTEGRATEPSDDLQSLLRSRGLPRSPSGAMVPTEALAELRDDER